MRKLTPKQREARRKYQREYMRKYRQDDSEKGKARKEHVLAYQLAWSNKRYRDNPEYRAKCLARQLRYNLANKAKVAANFKRWWGKLTAEKKYARSLKSKYGMSLEEYHGMVSEQGGLCAICVNKLEEVDHNHKDGTIRGLLCNKCNKGLGFFNDDIALMEKAIAYLCSHNKSMNTQKAS